MKPFIELLIESKNKLPDMFSRTYYRLPNEEDLIDIDSYDLSAQELIKGFGYTIIGKGMNSQENQAKILKSLTMLYEKFPKSEYKKAVAIYQESLK